MPRSGVLGTATPPPGTVPKNPNDIIPSAAWNALFLDLYQIANTPVPTSYGGTGGANPEEARENLGVPPLPSMSGHIYRLTISNNVLDSANDIDVAPGNAASEDADPTLIVLASAITKRVDAAWMAGSGNGGWLDGASMPNGTGHVFVMRRPDNGGVDVGVSASLTPTLPANYTQKRLIGSVVRLSGTLLQFTQDGDEFLYKTPGTSIALSNPGSAAVLHNLPVPLGRKLGAIINVVGENVAGAVRFANIVTSPDQNDVAATRYNGVPEAETTSGFSQVMGQKLTIRTNTSGQVRTRAFASDASCTLYITTYGWIDTRGRV